MCILQLVTARPRAAGSGVLYLEAALDGGAGVCAFCRLRLHVGGQWTAGGRRAGTAKELAMQWLPPYCGGCGAVCWMLCIIDVQSSVLIHTQSSSSTCDHIANGSSAACICGAIHLGLYWHCEVLCRYHAVRLFEMLTQCSLTCLHASDRVFIALQLYAIYNGARTHM